MLKWKIKYRELFTAGPSVSQLVRMWTINIISAQWIVQDFMTGVFQSFDFSSEEILYLSGSFSGEQYYYLQNFLKGSKMLLY